MKKLSTEEYDLLRKAAQLAREADLSDEDLARLDLGLQAGSLVKENGDATSSLEVALAQAQAAEASYRASAPAPTPEASASPAPAQPAPEPASFEQGMAQVRRELDLRWEASNVISDHGERRRVQDELRDLETQYAVAEGEHVGRLYRRATGRRS